MSDFNTAIVTDMSFMFDGCNLLTVLDVSNFQTQNVTNMSFMFANCINDKELNVLNFEKRAKIYDEELLLRLAHYRLLMLLESRGIIAY